MSDYQHAGWTGVPYASDFEAKWGTIKLSEMYVAKSETSITEAAKLTRDAGLRYMICDKVSRLDNRLYKVSKTNARCVVGMAKQMAGNAQRENEIYHSDLKRRIYQIVRVTKGRATVFDLDPEEILQRVLVGYCEATGFPLVLDEVGSPFGPALDQIVPGGGYTKSNIRVVCNAFNRLKWNGTDADADRFLQFVRSGEFTFKPNL